MNVEMPVCDSDSLEKNGKFFYHKYVSELCVTLGACDTVLCLEPVAALLHSLESLHQGRKPKPDRAKSDNSGTYERPELPYLTSSNIPLIYADVECARLFIPGNDGAQTEERNRDIVSTIDHDMLIFEVSGFEECF